MIKVFVVGLICLLKRGKFLAVENKVIILSGVTTTCGPRRTARHHISLSPKPLPRQPMPKPWQKCAVTHLKPPTQVKEALQQCISAGLTGGESSASSAPQALMCDLQSCSSDKRSPSGMRPSCSIKHNEI